MKTRERGGFNYELGHEIRLFRACPKCGRRWNNKGDWEAASARGGKEIIKHRYQTDRGERRVATIAKSYRTHLDCGGQNWDAGYVLFDYSEAPLNQEKT